MSALGPKMAEALKRRLADLRAARYVGDLLAGSPRELDGADQRHMAIGLTDGHRMVFAANHTRNMLTEAGRVDWTMVSRIKVLRIERNDE